MNRQHQIRFVVEQLFGLGKTDIIDNTFSVNYEAHIGDKTYKGHQFIKRYTRQVRRAIPDIKICSVEFLSLTDNIITWKRTFTGTHKADMRGIPASDKKIKWYEIVVTRFNKEKIDEEWVASDFALQLILKHTPKK